MNAFVLAGGRSTRMGRDKAQLLLHGLPLIVRALEALRSLGYRPRICGARPDLSAFAEMLPDRLGGCGPLGGIEAALSASDSDLNLFIPVDTPLIPLDFLRWMIGRAEVTGAVATIPRLGERPEPLCAIYSRRLLAPLTASLQEGRFKVMAAVSRSAQALRESVDLFQLESVAAALPPGCWPVEPPLPVWFRNVNTPADYERLRLLPQPGANGRHPIS